MNKTFQIAAVLAAFAFLLAGCGGGSDETTSSLTKAQFIKKADAICAKADEEQVDAMQKAQNELPGDFNDRARQIEIVVDYGLPPVREQAEEISALGAPSGDEDQVAAIVDGIEEAVSEIEADPQASNLETAFTEVDRLSARYGFKACSEAV